MKYETPELTALTAINSIQQTDNGNKSAFGPIDSVHRQNDVFHGYADWE